MGSLLCYNCAESRSICLVAADGYLGSTSHPSDSISNIPEDTTRNGGNARRKFQPVDWPTGCLNRNNGFRGTNQRLRNTGLYFNLCFVQKELLDLIHCVAWPTSEAHFVPAPAYGREHSGTYGMSGLPGKTAPLCLLRHQPLCVFMPFQ